MHWGKISVFMQVSEQQHLLTQHCSINLCKTSPWQFSQTQSYLNQDNQCLSNKQPLCYVIIVIQLAKSAHCISKILTIRAFCLTYIFARYGRSSKPLLEYYTLFRSWTCRNAQHSFKKMQKCGRFTHLTNEWHNVLSTVECWRIDIVYNYMYCVSCRSVHFHQNEGYEAIPQNNDCSLLIRPCNNLKIRKSKAVGQGPYVPRPRPNYLALRTRPRTNITAPITSTSTQLLPQCIVHTEKKHWITVVIDCEN